MTLTEHILAAGVVGIELGLIALLWFRPLWRGIQKNTVRRLLSFVLLQFPILVLIVVGGYLEKEEQVYSRLRKPYDEYKHAPSVDLDIDGDPGLVHWVQQQVPDLPRPDVASRIEFQEWQTLLRDQLRTLFDIDDIETPGDVQYHTLDSTSLEHGIIRELLVFTAFDGTSIPAYLFVPEIQQPRPAILVLHGHIGEYDEGISQTAGLVPSYHNSAALVLARAGFVTLTLEFRGFGFLGPHIDTNHKLVAYNAILGGRFYKAILTKDVKYAFDLLQALPQVDSSRIGITGTSFGGEMAVTYAALDTRVAAVNYHSFGITAGPRPGIAGRDTPQPFYTHIIPGHNRHVFQEDFHLLIAPRPLLGVSGSLEASGEPEYAAALHAAYARFEVPSLFQFTIEPGGHEFFPRPAVMFFQQYL